MGDRAVLTSLEPVAIVGMACRAPGQVKTTQDLWNLLAERGSGWSSIPSSRFKADSYYHPDSTHAGTFNARGGCFLDQDPAVFDAAFFNISNQEAKAMDPQHRILLECVYEALENGGIPKESLAGESVGVFVGGTFSDYELHNMKDIDRIPLYQSTGCAQATFSGRISYLFDFRGPCMTVDTACSSSMVAIHLAVQSLRQGESSVALTGSCHLNLTPDHFVSISNPGLLSDSGKCFSFDKRGTGGFGRGEGAGCLVLKRLSDAVRAGDSIRALIMHTGVNQDGKTDGITLPSAAAQERLMHQVYREAGCDKSQIGFIEAHGTGTKVGDPLEATAIRNAFSDANLNIRSPLYIGSIKSNISHAEGASGVLAIIKTAMMLERGFILPNHDFDTAKDGILTDDWHIKVPKKQLPWPRGKRYAGVNNFGFGGTNAHVLMARYSQPTMLAKTPKIVVTDSQNAVHGTCINGHDSLTGPSVRQPSSLDWKLYCLSASHKQGLQDQCRDLGIYLQRHPVIVDGHLIDRLAYTLGQRRSKLTWRWATTASSWKDLTNKMAEAIEPTPSELPRVVFVFTGQGAQWAGMGCELMAYPVYANAMKRADDYIASLGSSFSLIEELEKGKEASSISEAGISQPVSTAVQIALTDLLVSWGVNPLAVVGHSSGEVAAAYAAGILSLTECMSIAYYRGQASEKLAQSAQDPKGAMMAVGAGVSELFDTLSKLQSGLVTAACKNSPRSTTISGDEPAIAELQQHLDKSNIFCRRLQVSVAYHSHHMIPAAQEYLSAIGRLSPQQSLTQVAFYSAVHGRRVEDHTTLGAQHWADSLVSPVEFSAALAEIITSETAHSQPLMLIELGPHSALKGPINDILKGLATQQHSPIHYASSLLRSQNGLQSMQQLAATLFCRGINVRVDQINFPHHQPDVVPWPGSLTNLPPYPWNKTVRYWHESRIGFNVCHRPFPRHDILGWMVPESDNLEPRWRNIIRPDALLWMNQHQSPGQYGTLPLSFALVMVVEASAQQASLVGMQNYSGCQIRDVTIYQQTACASQASVPELEVSLTMRTYTAQGRTTISKLWMEFRIASWTLENGWQEACRGLVAMLTKKEDVSADEELTFDYDGIQRVQLAAKKTLDVSTLVRSLESKGIHSNHSLNCITGFRTGPGCLQLDFTAPDTAKMMANSHESNYIIHPAVLDICLQSEWLQSAGETPNWSNRLHVPRFIKSMNVTTALPTGANGMLHCYYSNTPSNSSNPDSAGGGSKVWLAAGLESKRILLHVDGLATCTLSEQVGASGDRAGNDEEDVKQNLHFKVDMVPCFDFVDLANPPPTPPVSVNGGGGESPDQHGSGDKMDRIAQYLMSEAYQTLGEEFDVSNLPDWAKKLFDVIRMQCSTAMPAASSQPSLGLVNIQGEGALEQMIWRVGTSLPQIIRQEQEPLSLMMEGGLMERYYDQHPSLQRSHAQMVRCIDIMADENPRMRILEVGAGTGGTTLPVLNCLGGGNYGRAARFSSYIYTDISTGYFEKAQRKLAAWEGLLEFHRLDVTKACSEQGFTEKSFDLVIASNVLHATPNATNALRHVHQLIKPGGKLVMMEMTTSRTRQFIYATQPGWWLTEDHGVTGSRVLLSVEGWDTALKEAEFSGVDTQLEDYPDVKDRETTVMISTAVETSNSTQSEFPQDVVILTNTTSEPVNDTFLPMLVNQITILVGKGKAKAIEISQFKEGDIRGRVCVVLEEPNHSILHKIGPDIFRRLQNIISLSRGVLWISRSSPSPSPLSSFAVVNEDENGKRDEWLDSGPINGIITGIARSIRTETNVRFATVLLKEGNGSNQTTTNGGSLALQHSTSAVARIFATVFGIRLSVLSTGNMEYVVEQDGRVVVPRVFPDSRMHHYMMARSGARKVLTEQQLIKRESKPLTLKVQQPVHDQLESILFFSDQDSINEAPPLADDEIEMQVYYVGLGSLHLVAVLEDNISPSIFECSGIVSRCGSNVLPSHMAVGDRICTLTSQHISTVLRLSASSSIVCKIPDTVTLPIAACIPMTYSTAYYALVKVAQLQAGESILVHAAGLAGGVGQAAIQIAAGLSAVILATVDNLVQKEYLVNNFRLSADRVFIAPSDGDDDDAWWISFAARLRKASSGDGVDVVLNSLSGEASRACWGCIKQFGRFVEISNAGSGISAPSRSNVLFMSINVNTLTEQRPSLVKALVKDSLTLVNQTGAIPYNPRIARYSALQIQEAFQAAGNRGRADCVVVEFKEGDAILANIDCSSSMASTLSRNKTYIIVGGTGGIGRSIARWFSQSGARHLVLVSRSGGRGQAAGEVAKLMDELQLEGVQVIIVTGDVTDTSNILHKLEHTLKQLPPVAGLVYGAYIFQDTAFNTMSHQDFSIGLDSKVAGVWNIHNALIKGKYQLDFFILLSSASSIVGGHHQSSYAGTGSFMDAFTNHRLRLGLPCSVLHLGPVQGIGYLADHKMEETYGRFMSLIRPDELRDLLQEAILQNGTKSITGVSVTARTVDSFWAGEAKFSHLKADFEAKQARSSAKGSDKNKTPQSSNGMRGRKLQAAIHESADPKAVIIEAMRHKLSKILMREVVEINPNKPLHDYGLDSLVAIELRNWFVTEMGVKLQILSILGAESMAYLANDIVTGLTKGQETKKVR